MIPYGRLVALRRDECRWERRVVAAVWAGWLILAIIGWVMVALFL